MQLNYESPFPWNSLITDNFKYIQTINSDVKQFWIVLFCKNIGPDNSVVGWDMKFHIKKKGA